MAVCLSTYSAPLQSSSIGVVITDFAKSLYYQRIEELFKELPVSNPWLSLQIELEWAMIDEYRIRASKLNIVCSCIGQMEIPVEHTKFEIEMELSGFFKRTEWPFIGDR